MPTTEPGTIVVSLEAKGLPKKKSFSTSATVDEVVRSLMNTNKLHEISSILPDIYERKLTIRTGSSSKSYSFTSIRMMRLQDLMEELSVDTDLIFSFEEESIPSSKKVRGRRSQHQSQFSRSTNQKPESKFNEYFGGDSTLTLAGDEDEDDGIDEEDIVDTVTFKHDDIVHPTHDEN